MFLPADDFALERVELGVARRDVDDLGGVEGSRFWAMTPPSLPLNARLMTLRFVPGGPEADDEWISEVSGRRRWWWRV